MGLIPEDIIRQVMDRCSIVDVISGYVLLKHAGRNFKAPCPFHHEKTPSFVVNPDKQIFHCFGCGVGGNVITFVMKQERLEFPEAVRLLAERAGIEIPAGGPQNNQAHQLRQQILQVNSLTAQYFHQNLLSDKSEATKAARDYLKGRGISLEMAKKFHLGFALEQWDGLIAFLRQQNYSLDFLEKAGLVIPQNKGNGYYDRFRDRVIFPICDIRGQYVAFGARTLQKDNQVKYINSPETPVYTKGQYLYGLHLAKDAIARRDFAIVVEGYMDFITPYAVGVQPLVASLGTALTVEQIRLLRRFTKNVVMLFDADQAGQAATVRSLDMLIEEGMAVSVAALSPGEDPDSFVRKMGVAAFEERLARAESVFDFKLKFLLQQHKAGTIENNARIAEGMLPTIRKFNNAIVQSEYMKRLAQTLMVSQEALVQEFKKIKDPVQPAPAVSLQGRQDEPEDIRPVERNILRLMLEERDFIPLVCRDVTPEDFQNSRVRQIVQKIYELFSAGAEPGVQTLLNCFEDEKIVRIISEVMTCEDLLAGDKEKIYRDCLRRLREDRLRVQRRGLLTEMETARSHGNQQRLEELTLEFNQLIKGL